MRPEKLVISAFGPYAGRVEINLDKLGEKGIYLITGDTGAGKTTIFDAITFALFGEASGENREAFMFRSKYAKPETPTEVQMFFSYSEKKYCIKRNPEYERPKSRGEGFTIEKANAELNLPDGRVITKLKEVNNAVVEILGVDRNQFSQIAMIAQGDFLKLLLATTDERKKIFQKLFKTKNYYNLQEKLKNESGMLGREYDNIKSSIGQYINGIICDEDNTLSILVKKAKENEIPVSEIIDVIKALIKEDSETEEKLDFQIKILDKKIEEITEILTQAQTLKAAEESLAKSEESLLAAMEKKISLEEKLKIEEGRKVEIDEIIKKIATLEAESAGYNELENNKRALKEKLSEKETDEKLLTEENEKHTLLTEKLDALENELKTLSDLGAQTVKLENEIKFLSGEKNALDNLEQESSKLHILEEKLFCAQKEYKIKSDISSEKRAVFDMLSKAYLDEQAGILAKTLSEGKPCPVCGSLNHPAPAGKSEKAPSREELEIAKKDAETAQKAEQEASLDAGHLKGVVTEKREALIKLSKELSGETPAQIRKKEIETALSVLEEELKEATVLENRRKEIELLVPDVKEKLEDLKKSISSLSENIAKHSAVTETIEKRISKLKENLLFESKNDAFEEKNKLEQRKAVFEKAFEDAKKAFEENEKNINALESRIEENKKLLENREEMDISVREEEKAQLKNEREEILTLQKQIHSRKSANISSLENIRKKSDEIKSVEEKWMWVKALSNTANGNISGKEKIMLETYIQMTYFDRIINRANLRLMVMSGGQYELKRRLEAENNRSQSGLELDVIDHYNGTMRSVKTLSGGESFKASLSLALGLSDEIQSSAGGIKLDTMFVDEGFGSLDEESLAQAVKALSGLSEGNRLVGIISHVSELKERIDKQIVVTKEKSGGSKVFINL